MKLLIMVLSYAESPFYEFMKTQQETWDSVEHEGIDTVYYFGKGSSENQKELSLNCSDEYKMMHWKFKLALERIDYHSYDIIFRTNSCSYIDKNKIYDIATSLPSHGCYAGYDNGGYVSGAGIFFSPDILDILKDKLTEELHYAEDVLFGEILSGRVKIKSDYRRIDAKVEGIDRADSYHYRFKTSNDLSERIRDINNMKKLHQKINKK